MCVLKYGIANVVFRKATIIITGIFYCCFSAVGICGEEMLADDILKALATPTEATQPKKKFRLRGIRVAAKKPAPSRSANLTIHFGSNSTEIQDRSMVQIGEIAKALKKMNLANTRVALIGHTDSRGDSTHNLDLSKRRSQAVAELLISQYEISANNLVTEGKGESELLVDPEMNDTDYKKNRRVELKLLNK